MSIPKYPRAGPIPPINEVHPGEIGKGASRPCTFVPLECILDPVILSDRIRSNQIEDALSEAMDPFPRLLDHSTIVNKTTPGPGLFFNSVPLVKLTCSAPASTPHWLA